MARKPNDRLRVRAMPAKFDGSGVVKLQCSEGVYYALKLHLMPRPRDYGEMIGGAHVIAADTRSMGADAKRYRVIWPDLSNGPGSKLRTSSFTLGPTHSNETLFVLAEFLRTQKVEFIALGNHNGSRFKATGLSGSSLPYLPGTRLHSVLARCDLFLKPAPENSSPSGLQVHEPALHGEAS